MPPATNARSELPEDQSARAAAERLLLRCGRLPAGAREVVARLLRAGDPPPTVIEMAREFGVTDRTMSLWIKRARAAGLVTVERAGTRNRYRINFEALQRLADDKAGR